MDFMDFSFGSWLYFIDWLGLSDSEQLTGGGFNTTTVRPIGG